jgi:hypothetical protein
MTDATITGYLHSMSQAMTDIAGGICANIKICEKKRLIRSAVKMILVRSAS